MLPRVLSHAPSHIIRQVIEREEEETEVDEVVRSNVYSRPELVLLEWLNYHYTRQYRKVFGKRKQLIHKLYCKLHDVGFTHVRVLFGGAFSPPCMVLNM